MMRGLACVAAAALLAVCCPGAAGAATAGGAGPAVPWMIQAVPLPVGATNGGGLDSVSCTSAAKCTATGWYANSRSPYARPLAERWDGSTWRPQRPPFPAGGKRGFLFGVSCTSAASCTAVGYYTSSLKAAAPPVALAEYWNGSTWAVQPVPLPSGSRKGVLYAVSCTSAASCTATGLYTKSRATVALAEYWNGSTWTIQPTPSPSGSEGASLTGVSCTLAASCTAVGYYSTSSEPELTLAEYWDGSTWTIQPTPTPPGSGLGGVSCTSAASCTAVGFHYQGQTPERSLAESWDGSTWKIQPTPYPTGSEGVSLRAVSCRRTRTCTAAGTAITSDFIDLPLAEHK
jgi:hypothetical protein